MIKLESVEVGMTLYERHRTKMGNTTMKTLGEWPVKIIEICVAMTSDGLQPRVGAMVSWNGNQQTYWPRKKVEKLFTWSMYGPEAEVVRGTFGVISVKRKRAAKKVKQA